MAAVAALSVVCGGGVAFWAAAWGFEGVDWTVVLMLTVGAAAAGAALGRWAGGPRNRTSRSNRAWHGDLPDAHLRMRDPWQQLWARLDGDPMRRRRRWDHLNS